MPTSTTSLFLQSHPLNIVSKSPWIWEIELAIFLSSLYTTGGNINWYRHYGKEYEDSSKVKIELPDDPAIPVLGMYPKKMKSVP